MKRKDTKKTIKLMGKYSMNARGFGFVTVDGMEQDLFIPASQTMNAFQGDLVEVEVLPGDSHRVRSSGRRLEGSVVRIVERAITEVVGTFDRRGDCAFGFVIPDRIRLPQDIFIPAEGMKNAKNGDKVIVTITDYGDDRHSPEGEITQVLGHVGDPGVDVLSVIRAYGLPEDFPADVLEAARESASRAVSADGRKDLRDVLMVTIDGEDSKDLDDAVSLTYDGQFYHLGVHIADVAEYVKEDSVLDREALERGTSIYLADRVLPMLPQELSNGSCSLNEQEDRLAMSCLMTFDGAGQEVDHDITESVIRTAHRMTYTGVQYLLDHPEAVETDPAYKQYADVLTMLQEMASLAQILRNQRRRRGSVDFDLPECKLTLDENGRALDVCAYEHTPANDLIEEFMLAANETVAKHFYWLEAPFVYRVHEEPDGEKMRAIVPTIAAFGYSIKSVGKKGSKGHQNEIHPKEIQKLLAGTVGKPEEKLINRLVLRSMKQARYATACLGHFGLASEYYCHFTSPIRRYPDLQIHRIIKESLRGSLNADREEHYRSILDEVAEHSSKRERRAAEAERETDKLKKVEYISGHLGECFEGIISSVTKWGVYVELPNTVEGMIRINDLPGGKYIFDEERMQLFSSRRGNIYTLGMPMKVLVAAADPVMRTIDFVPAPAEEEE